MEPAQSRQGASSLTVHYRNQKSTTFFTHPGLEPGPRRRLRHSVLTVSVARLVCTAPYVDVYVPCTHLQFIFTLSIPSALDVTDAGVPCVAWTLGAGVPSVIETLGGTGTWSACHEPGTGWDWARSARVPSDTGTRVLGKSVTLQVPFWHCVHHGLWGQPG